MRHEQNAYEDHGEAIQLHGYGYNLLDIRFFEQKMAAEITTTAVVAAIHVRATAKIVSGHADKTIRNMFYYDGKRNVADELEIDLNPDCPHHLE